MLLKTHKEQNELNQEEINERMLEDSLAYKGYEHVRHKVPFVYTAKKEKLETLYFGTGHTNCFEDHMIASIHGTFASFNPDTLFVEGMRQVASRQYMEQLCRTDGRTLVSQYGENAYAAAIGYQKGMKLHSPEPDPNEESLFILKRGFDKMDILLFYMLQFVNQWLRSAPDAHLDTYIVKGLEYLAADMNWPVASAAQIYAYAERRYSIDVASLSSDDCLQMTDPIDRLSSQNGCFGILNQIARLSSVCRDIRLLRAIDSIASERRRLMIVYGATHAYVQKPALEKIGFTCS